MPVMHFRPDNINHLVISAMCEICLDSPPHATAPAAFDTAGCKPVHLNRKIGDCSGYVLRLSVFDEAACCNSLRHPLSGHAFPKQRTSRQTRKEFSKYTWRNLESACDTESIQMSSSHSSPR